MKKGFTLIELLVVVLIIGILAAIALPMYTKTVEKSRFAEGLVIGKSMTNAIDRLYLESNSDWLSNIADLDIDFAFNNVDPSVGELKNFQVFTNYRYPVQTPNSITVARTNDSNWGPDGDFYYLTFYTQYQTSDNKDFSGKILCTNVDKELCATFGAKTCTLNGSDYLCIN